MRRIPYLAIVVALVSVSFASIFIRWSESPPLVIAAYRLMFSALIVMPFAIGLHGEELKSLSSRDVALMVMVGGILAAHFALWITSLKVQGVTVASSVVLVTAHPVIVAPVSHFVLKDRVNAVSVVGVAVGLAGVVAIGVGAYGFSAAALGGNILALVGGVMAGAYIMAGRRFRQRISVLTYAFVVYSSCAVFLAISAFLADGMRPAGDMTRELTLFLLLAVVSQIGGHTVYNWSLKYVTATVVSVSLVGEPVGASILAWLLLGEVPAFVVAVGGVAAVVGTYLTIRGQLTVAREEKG